MCKPSPLPFKIWGSMILVTQTVAGHSKQQRKVVAQRGGVVACDGKKPHTRLLQRGCNVLLIKQSRRQSDVCSNE
jgi:hypothetical protein